MAGNDAIALPLENYNRIRFVCQRGVPTYDSLFGSYGELTVIDSVAELDAVSS